MSDVIQCIQGTQITPEFEREWSALFSRCYQSNEEKACHLIRKYKLNDSRLCILRANGRMVGCYAGLKLSFGSTSVFLSTDTMSDGTRRGASVLLGNYLYELLTEEGVLAVCGYPNDKIRGLRKKRLGWTMVGLLSMYIGVPLLWRLYRSQSKSDIWSLKRPSDGYFSSPIIGMNLLGREGLYSRLPGLVFTLAAKRPVFFFIRVPKRLFSPRTFGYRFLSERKEEQLEFLATIDQLDLETIDIP